MARKRKRLHPKGKWFATVALAFQRVSGKTQLVVALTPITTESHEADAWHVLALESPAGVGSQATLEQHAHKLIGTFPFAKAVLAAQSYANLWKPGRTDDCPCEDIPTPRPRRRGR